VFLRILPPVANIATITYDFTTYSLFSVLESRKTVNTVLATLA
jgi:hypothetical protein